MRKLTLTVAGACLVYAVGIALAADTQATKPHGESVSDRGFDISSAEWATAIGTAATAIATLLLVWVGIRQLGGLRDQLRSNAELEMRRSTLEAIQRYEKDPIVHGAMKTIWEASANGSDYTKLTDIHVFPARVTVNYFDGIAVGILQGIYIEQLVKDHMSAAVHKVVKALVKGQAGEGWKAEKSIVPEAGCQSLCAIYDRWYPKQKASVEYKAR